MYNWCKNWSSDCCLRSMTGVMTVVLMTAVSDRCFNDCCLVTVVFGRSGVQQAKLLLVTVVLVTAV